jgi:hypothetical protein
VTGNRLTHRKAERLPGQSAKSQQSLFGNGTDLAHRQWKRCR